MDSYIEKIAGRGKKAADEGDEEETDDEEEETEEKTDEGDSSAAEDALAIMCEYRDGSYMGGESDPAVKRLRKKRKAQMAAAFAEAIREIVGK